MGTGLRDASVLQPFMAWSTTERTILIRRPRKSRSLHFRPISSPLRIPVRPSQTIIAPGGYFLKLLADLDRLWVHYAFCENPETAEGMLRYFCDNVSAESKLRLRDPKHPFPFANLEHPKGEYKNHGLGNARYNARPTTASTEPVDFHIDGPDSAYAGLFFFPLQKSNGVVGGHTSPLPCADVAN